jgi:hypothetical protein
MKSRYLITLGACLIATSLGSVALLGLDTKDDQGKPEPEGAGIHWAKGHANGQAVGRGVRSPNLNYYGGPIMTTATTQAIFWGPKWGANGDTVFAGDKVAGLDGFYSGMGGSLYAGSSNEYYDASGNKVTSSVTHAGHVIDTSTATGGNQTGPILKEVCKVITNPVSNGYYPVYVDVRRGNANFCAWHSYGTCGGKVVQFAFFFDLDGDAGCDPQDSSTSHSQGLAALANVSGHELSEARSDPRLNAWYDSSGEENADKCAWTFGHPFVTFSNKSVWKIQGNWSNSAYNSGTGYLNSSGQKGCSDGQ